MYTDRVLNSIYNADLKRSFHIFDKDQATAPSPTLTAWFTDHDVHLQPSSTSVPRRGLRKGSMQQSDLLRNFYLAIAEEGLLHAYKNRHKLFGPGDLPAISRYVNEQDTTDIGQGDSGDSLAHSRSHVDQHNKTDADKKHVIIVGAGISGLVAAYELRKEGYKVDILEMSDRYGGRVKTLSQKDGFDRGLHTDAGAMRLPLPPAAPGTERPVEEMIHYLTDYYAERVFKLEAVPFSNQNDNAYYNFYGKKTKISEWKDSQFNEFWPKWDQRLKETGQTGITNIDTYYEKTVSIIIQILKNRLESVPPNDVKAQAEQWDLWTKNWCQFSFGSFLRSTLSSIKSQLKFDDKLTKNLSTLDELDLYLPWPEMAITCFTVFKYISLLDISLVSLVQEEMGKWWSSKMHSLKGGLSALPHAFASKHKGKVEELITYNRTVMKVEYNWTSNNEKSVTVSGVFTSSGQPFSITGRSVILTVPLNVLRGIKIVNSRDSGAPFPIQFQQAIQGITYMPSTKIMLQYKKQFWNMGKDPDTDITGGFSKTNLPIGQLHYPTEMKAVASVGGTTTDFVPQTVKEDQKGILMVYTWNAEALLWGALTEEQAITLAVNQIEELHPNSKDFYEMGRRQAWASDPTTLGGFALLRPREYISVIYLMQRSWENVYFAGEAISFANGWIQGALESGLRAAYQLFRDDQQVNKPGSPLIPNPFPDPFIDPQSRR